jgi:hypothetical protein
MPDFVVGIVGTFVLSLILAYGFLRLRCRRIGPLFGPLARPWSFLIVMGTAILSAGAGLLIVAASDHIHAAYVAIILPGGLWFSKMPPEHLVPRTVADWLALPFRRLYDRMGDDMQDWCETRLKAAAPKPQWIADAVTYYHIQVRGRLKDAQAQARLGNWQESITHKIEIVRLIELDTTPARLREALRKHPFLPDVRNYADDDLPQLASRLESDALNELNLFLGYIYHLGHYKLLIYPFRPSAQRNLVRRPQPTAPEV